MNAGQTYILVIAVENYHESTNFDRVDFAEKDARDFIDAFKKLNSEDKFVFTELINERATLSNILQDIKKVSKIAQKDDRIIIYFAGHGFYEDDENLLAPVDAKKTAKKDTCASVGIILGHLKKSESTQKILFFDCCHSGFEGGGIRAAADSFEIDELIYQFRQEQYVVGFASCKNHQTSSSNPGLRNGIWTHFLIKALTGEAKGIYEKGLLFSDQLQYYLNKTTSEFAKLNTVKKLDQTPVKFGTETNKFIIADLNPIFEAKKKKVENTDITLLKVSLLGEETDAVKKLPGFQSGSHKVPKYIGHATRNFVRGIAAELIKEEISDLSKKIRENIEYKRADIIATADSGSGSIETPHFDYSITVEQSEDEPSEYILVRRLENLTDPNLASSTALSKIFSRHFDKLSFETENVINITDLIDRIEDLKDSAFKVYYDDADLSSCQIKIDGLDYEIFVDLSSINVTYPYHTNPGNLVTAFQETRTALQQNPELKLLE